MGTAENGKEGNQLLPELRVKIQHCYRHQGAQAVNVRLHAQLRCTKWPESTQKQLLESAKTLNNTWKACTIQMHVKSLTHMNGPLGADVKLGLQI